MSSQKGAVERAWRKGLEATSDTEGVVGVAERRRGGRMRRRLDSLEVEIEMETRVVVSRGPVQSWTCKRRVMERWASVLSLFV